MLFDASTAADWAQAAAENSSACAAWWQVWAAYGALVATVFGVIIAIFTLRAFVSSQNETTTAVKALESMAAGLSRSVQAIQGLAEGMKVSIQAQLALAEEARIRMMPTMRGVRCASDTSSEMEVIFVNTGATAESVVVVLEVSSTQTETRVSGFTNPKTIRPHEEQTIRVPVMVQGGRPDHHPFRLRFEMNDQAGRHYTQDLDVSNWAFNSGPVRQRRDA